MDITDKNKQKLIMLENFIDSRFVESDGKTVSFLSNGEKIPKEHLHYGSTPKSGLYYLSKCNCGNDKCDVGKPARKCVIEGMYCEGKCAVYSFTKAEDKSIKISDIIDAVDI